MASRRDELNAHTFAKKRLLAAFLQPTPSGTEEGAPRPLRAVVPGLIIGALVLAGFGAWGMFKPKAPKDWDQVAENVIIGSDSTSLYVVLETDGKKQLHPVLNRASAKLLLDSGEAELVEVDEETLDSGKIPHGATIGIPYAPDRLPDEDEATKQKTWAVCTQTGGGASVQQAGFVFAEREKDAVAGGSGLKGGQVMSVEDADGNLFIVDHGGNAYPLATDVTDSPLYRTLIGTTAPQEVSDDWLRTLHEGDEVQFPQVAGIGNPADVPGSLAPEADRIGMVLKSKSGSKWQHYVVLENTVKPVTPFVADLLLNSAESGTLDQNGRAREVNAGAIAPENAFYSKRDWPTQEARVVNSAQGGRDTLCSVLQDVDVDGKVFTTELTTWAGTDYPKQLPNGATSGYVTPGSGLLLRQVKGNSAGTGAVFLVTDTGLRYALQGNKDSDQGDSGIGKNDKQKEELTHEEGNRAQIRLGYKDAEPVPVPAPWATLLPTGPRLSTEAARQPQGS
ncbi:hypothetical protein N566_26085 [Streptomycetaceae bacterium MP113-05]|nr:hypothetical protein N566_26085 [Streptomycetaceae bacterium MP113-05]